MFMIQGPAAFDVKYECQDYDKSEIRNLRHSLWDFI